MPDLPPPNWYTDPSDESQYRYWDGSVWTDYRAPRLAEAVGERLRGSGELIRDSFALLRRQWRVCSVATLISAAGYVVCLMLLMFSADKILMGELGEIWARISSPGFDPESAEERAYFESLQFDFSVWNFVPGVLGLLAAWVSARLFAASIILSARRDLRGGNVNAARVLRQACRRIPRLLGVDLQILAIYAVGIGIVVLAGVLSPWLLILFIPAFLVFLFGSTPVVWSVDVVASAGPSEPSLLYAARLVRKRFWGVMGRVLLILLVVTIIGFVIGAVFGAVNSSLGSFWLLGESLSAVVSGFPGAMVSIAMAIIYLDLDGDWEQEP